MTSINVLSIVRNNYSRLNNFLITKHPFIWQTQVHLVVIYTIIFGLATFLAGFFYPISFRELCSIDNAVSTTKYNYGALCISANMLFLIYWRKKIVQYKNTDFSWRSSSIEALIYLGGVMLLWCASNMFNLGINTKIGFYTLKGEGKYATLMHDTNFMINGYIPHADSNKMKDLHGYFDHGDSLLSGLMNRVFDLNEPEFKVKRYYNTQNKIEGLEQYYDYDSISYTVDSTYFYFDDFKQKYYPYKKDVKSLYSFDKNIIEKQDNYQKIDTILSKFVFGNLQYSFDEFVPKINYDNYFSINESVPVNQLGYQNYKKLIDSSQYVISDIIYEDFVRFTGPQKILAGRKNFLESMTSEEKKRYNELRQEIIRVFSSEEILITECSLLNPIYESMLKNTDAKEEEYKNYLLKKQSAQAGLMGTNENKTVRFYKTRFHLLDSLAKNIFRKDSIDISNKLIDFNNSLNQEAKSWYRIYNTELHAYLKPLFSSNPFIYGDYNDKYFVASRDTLIKLNHFNESDSMLCRLLKINERNSEWKVEFNTYVENKINNLAFKQGHLKSLQTIIDKGDIGNYETNRKYRDLYYLDNSLYYEYTNNEHYNITRLVNRLVPWLKNMAFSRIYPIDFFDFNDAIEIENIKTLDYLVLNEKKIRLDSVNINAKQLITEIKNLVPILRKEITENAPDSIKVILTNLEKKSVNNYYSDILISSMFSDSSLFQDPAGILRSSRNDGFYGLDYNNIREIREQEPCIKFPRIDFLNGLPTFTFVCFQKYRFEKYKSYFTPQNLDFFRQNGFNVPSGVSDNETAFRYMSYYGLDMAKGIREVYKARKNIRHFISHDVLQRHILSLLIFINAILFFTVSFETKVITSAFALAFLMLILLNFFLGKFLDANSVSNSGFPTIKQKIVFLTILIPLIFSILSLILTRRKITLPGFMMNMVVVFALSLLTTNPNLYYGDNLQKVENPAVQMLKPQELTQYDLFYYLTLYLGITISLGSILLRKNQVLPEKRV